jgi:hypothetical protein
MQINALLTGADYIARLPPRWFRRLCYDDQDDQLVMNRGQECGDMLDETMMVHL